jgi:hypothetical protein
MKIMAAVTLLPHILPPASLLPAKVEKRNLIARPFLQPIV